MSKFDALIRENPWIKQPDAHGSCVNCNQEKATKVITVMMIDLLRRHQPLEKKMKIGDACWEEYSEVGTFYNQVRKMK